jgi:splicing factor 3B subunit 4
MVFYILKEILSYDFKKKGQYFCNRIIHVSYAYKRDTKGERHGSAAGMILIDIVINNKNYTERLLAANRPINSRVVAPPMFTPQMNPEFNNNYQQQPTLQ